MESSDDDLTTRRPCDEARPSGGRVELGLVEVFPVPGADGFRAWPVERRGTIGRHGSCAVQLQDRAVSRQHAVVERGGSHLVVADAGSRFGTFLEGRRLGESAVEAAVGQLLKLGNTLLLVVEAPRCYEAPPRKLAASYLDLPHEVFAGPSTWAHWQTAIAAAPLAQPVLIMGESGTGKEVLARLLQRAGPAPTPFVAVNLAAIPEQLFEAELFGCTRGAFTGATQTKLGAFREANGGTLFLDEIGELRLDLQAKLLRVLETNRVRPLGSGGEIGYAARVVAATNCDLEAAVSQGTFRADLYYRLSGIVIRTRPLRERRDEVLLVAQNLFRRQLPASELTPSTAEALVLHPWPGNLRELANVVARAALTAKEAGATTIHPGHLSLPRSAQSEQPSQPSIGERQDISTARLRHALHRASGNATKAAELLGVSRAGLYSFCTRNNIDIARMRADLQQAESSACAPSVANLQG